MSQGSAKLEKNYVSISMAVKELDTGPIEAELSRVAFQVKRAAQQNHNQISVKVSRYHGGVRMVIRGKRAGHYKELATAELNRHIPELSVKIRELIVSAVNNK